MVWVILPSGSPSTLTSFWSNAYDNAKDLVSMATPSANQAVCKLGNHGEILISGAVN